MQKDTEGLTADHTFCPEHNSSIVIDLKEAHAGPVCASSLMEFRPPASEAPDSLANSSASSRSHLSAMSSTINASQHERILPEKAMCLDLRLFSTSSLIPLNFFSRSPRKSSIASASFVAASVVGACSMVED
jgi:hypothetical protein